jgi:hypothetical protein
MSQVTVQKFAHGRNVPEGAVYRYWFLASLFSLINLISSALVKKEKGFK